MSRNPFHAGEPFRGFHGSHICYGLPVCSPPCTDPTSFPAVGDFYVQASGGSVTLPAAGYDYSGGWTPPLVGLAPTGTTASLAAQHLRFPGDPYCAFAPFQDPGRTDSPSPIAVLSVLPLLLRRQRLQRHDYIEANARLRHLLSTLQGRCCHRHMQDSLPAGWLAFAGRELNPLDRYERFPSCYISSPFPGFILTLHSFIDVDHPKAAARHPIHEVANQTERPQCAYPREPVFNETSCVAFDELSVTSVL